MCGTEIKSGETYLYHYIHKLCKECYEQQTAEDRGTI